MITNDFLKTVHKFRDDDTYSTNYSWRPRRRRKMYWCCGNGQDLKCCDHHKDIKILKRSYYLIVKYKSTQYTVNIRLFNREEVSNVINWIKHYGVRLFSQTLDTEKLLENMHLFLYEIDNVHEPYYI